MTDEKLPWFRVASHLGMTVREARSRMSYEELLDWLEFLRWEQKQVNKEDLYLAQIAATIMRSVVKNPKQVRLEHYLLKFDDRTVQEKASHSIAVWNHFLGKGGGMTKQQVLKRSRQIRARTH